MKKNLFCLLCLISKYPCFFRYVLYFDYFNPIHSHKVCVKSCPEVTISDITSYVNYSNETQSLCFYNITKSNYDPKLCPSFPIFKSKAVAHR